MYEELIKDLEAISEVTGGGRMSQYDLIPYKGESLMTWAICWFNMSNDGFYELYGFNFNPHDYPGLYEQARKRVYPNE